ncbi:hypothetical protein MFIFM68171_01058 [Madurella fahalii]|uniref:SnoaL-like domain-containing protein n=1 Tax=Madurella fahalii TaxID=1157608 RepID=A0ABQ0FZE1_9PEZI
MAPVYDTLQYLLDRANIHDVISKVPLYYDTCNLEGLTNEVYADEIHVDYTSILGGEPFVIPRSEWVDKIDVIMKGFASTQHVTSCIIADLPQPAPGATRPEKVNVLAEANGAMVGLDETASPLTINGGLLVAEVKRDIALENQGLNPWRITKYKVVKKWDSGDASVFDRAKKSMQ